MKYDHGFLKEISDKVNLLEYASQTFTFSQRGDSYFTHCPRHIDQTASLAIRPKKNAFYCYSCGVGGGIVQWLTHIEKLSFDEAVRKAAFLAGTELKKMCQSETVMFNRAVQKNLTQAPRDYRHEILDYSVYKKFPRGRITEWLDEGIRQREIIDFDIRIDPKSNRIIYPVRDIEGNLINIKGRTRFADYKKIGVSKYINYYEVGVMDYFQSLDMSLPYIKQSGEIKIVEGIKSVMKLYGCGVKDVVSAEKHALTKEQIILLIKLGVDVVLCYDSDVNYDEKRVTEDIKLLKKFTNVYLVKDPHGLLGGKDAKNSPIDCGFETWKQLYGEKVRIY